MRAAGEWSTTLQGQNFGPVEAKGYWSAVFGREGDRLRPQMEIEITANGYELARSTVVPNSEHVVLHLKRSRSAAPTPRTCSNDGSNKPDCRRTIRLTHFGQLASRIFWKMTALLKPLSALPATPTAVPRNSMTAAGRRFCSRIGRGFGIEGCFAPPEICYLILKERPIGH
jgi:hypothetical protein